ncbi:MAG: AAA family ATPase [Candidatus Dormibacteraeota bacterium]|nr:AAA family ATPase [Candidatus Dormibacteraeota bacterium]
MAGVARHPFAPARVEAPFRGRVRELDRLRQALAALAAGIPVRLLVVGEEGVGKSRLIGEALSSSDLRHLTVHTGRAAELETDRPFGVLSDALDLRPRSPDPEAAAIGSLFGGSSMRDREEERHDAMLRIISLLARRAELGPVALVLEDMQWADRFSVLTLLRLARECQDRPIGVFVTRRMLPLRAPVNDLVDGGRHLFERVDLDALDSEIVALMVHDVLGAAPGPRLQGLVDAAGGNPGLLLGLVSGLQHDQALQVTDDGVETATSLPPATLRPLVRARIAGLTDRCQDVLTVAAVFERPFGVATLAAIAGRLVVDVLTDLREALAARVLLEVAGVLSFQHELVRAILYEETPVSIRAELHRQIGEVLRASAGSPALVGHHLLRAAELSRGPSDHAWPDERERTSMRWELLTPAERDVAVLVGKGLKNKEVGARLHVSARTVETHLAHMYAKLGLASRVELAAAMARARDETASNAGQQASNGAGDGVHIVGVKQIEPARKRRPASGRWNEAPRTTAPGR